MDAILKHTSKECYCPEAHAVWHIEYKDDGTSHEHNGYYIRRCLACHHFFPIGRDYKDEAGLYCGDIKCKERSLIYG